MFLRKLVIIIALTSVANFSHAEARESAVTTKQESELDTARVPDQYSYTKQELLDLENNLTKKIKTNISEYLDKDTRFSLSLTFQLKKSIAKINKGAQDLGYLVVPAVQDSLTSIKTFEIQNANITVFLYSKYPDEFLTSIRSIVNGATEGQLFPVKINFSYLVVPPIEVTHPEIIAAKEKAAKEKAEAEKIALEKAEVEKLTLEKAQTEKIALEKAEAEKLALEKSKTEKIALEKKQAEEVKAAIAAAKKAQKSIWDYVQENALPLAILLGTISFALSLVIGVFVFSKFFKSSIFAVADSLKETNKGSSKDKADQHKKEIALNAPAVKSDSYERNIKIISNIIETTPYVFTCAISEKENDYLGLKKLIPHLFASTDTTIQDLFTEETIAKIEEKAELAQEMSTGEFYMWLDHFVERLALNHMKKGNRYTRIIEKDLLGQIYGLESEKLIKYALKKNSGIVFKLVMDFLPPDSIKKLFDQLSTEQWKSLMLDEKGVNVESINAEARSLYDEVYALKEQSSQDIGSKEALEEVLMTPITSYLLTKPLSAYDEYFDHLSTLSPAISSKIKEKIWPPSVIAQIPVEYLRKKVNDYNITEKEYLLIGFSGDISKLISNNLTEGKMKQVLLSDLAKAKGKYTKEKATQAERFCKSFLQTLHEDCLNGEFELQKGTQTQSKLTIVPSTSETDSATETDTEAVTDTASDIDKAA